ncbi:MAG: hypothetical protein OXU66_01655 [Gammaproteobacteria bacterium]|nr:hypothetical protein [Gammaproteobacteria bacterium]MDD9896903.1 hypothetical protein [Gammaproteobacteria bacterium]MDD9957621.1 hypothetical protein [Gammaproteobacteria bacterium]
MKIVVISFTCLALFTCRSADLANWPRDLPARQYFVAVYEADEINQEVQSREAYLQWILSFYAGTVVAPTGWNEMQLAVVESAPADRKVELEEQLFLLGRQIAAEWAKENAGRVIDSRMLGVWGSVLQLVVGADQQHAAIQLISSDVSGLLQNQLNSSEINDLRYEERLGLQLFGDF